MVYEPKYVSGSLLLGPRKLSVGCSVKLEFPRGMESMLQHPNLDMPTDFVDGPINYLGRAYGNAYDFRQVKMDKWEID